jgi:hypothetical protein
VHAEAVGWIYRDSKGGLFVTPPTWLYTAGRRRPALACWTCGREVAPMRYRAADLRRHGWTPPETLQIPDWYGCSTEYLPVPDGDGWWSLVPIWEPTQTPSPLRRWAPAVPYWAADPGPQP